MILGHCKRGRGLPEATTTLMLWSLVSALTASSRLRLQLPAPTPRLRVATAGRTAFRATHSRPAGAQESNVEAVGENRAARMACTLASQPLQACGSEKVRKHKWNHGM